MPTRLLFVCMGNICRSPTAEAVMRSLVAGRGLTEQFDIDSAGTGHWHVGDRPDRRAAEAAQRRGITLTGRARQVSEDDFLDFDWLIAMDEQNLADLHRMAPPGATAKIRKLGGGDVPDPYYGGPSGFDDVLDIVTAGCDALLDELRQD